MTQAAPASPRQEGAGPLVTTTIDIVDTGERRPFGRYTARHVTTAVVVDAAPGASALSRTYEQSGWYVDLPNRCADGSGLALLGGSFVAAGNGARPPDRERVQYRGRARRGFAIDERDDRSTLELVDFSEAPLDDALFTVSKDYRPALVTPFGGVDMMKPDTFVNRAELYARMFVSWVESVFR